jgi:hypothetical protein
MCFLVTYLLLGRAGRSGLKCLVKVDSVSGFSGWKWLGEEVRAASPFRYRMSASDAAQCFLALFLKEQSNPFFWVLREIRGSLWVESAVNCRCEPAEGILNSSAR